MKNDLFFPSYSEFIQRSDIIKRRQERLIQVRQQSKKMAATLIERMKVEAEKQYENTEKRILNEIWEQHSKELTSMRRVYEECILNINQEHYNKPITKSAAPNARSVRMSVPGKEKLRECSPGKCLSTSTQKQDTRKIGASKDTCPNIRSVPNQQANRSSCSLPNEQNKSALKEKLKPNSTVKQTHREFAKFCTRPNAQSSNPVKKNNSGPVRTISSRCFREPIHKLNDAAINNDIVIISPKNPPVEHEKEDYLSTYTSQVHDRIRILEQKEKILQRRIPILPDNSNVPETVHPKRRIENDSNSNTQNHAASENYMATNSTTEKTASRNLDSVRNADGAGPTIEKTSSSDETNKPAPPVTTKSASVAASSMSEDAIPNPKTSPQKTSSKTHSPRSCNKRRRRCRHTNLYKDEDVVIVVRNHRSGVTITTDDKLTTQNTSSESSIAQEFVPRRKNTKVTLDVSNAENKIRNIKQLLNECDSRVPRKETTHKLHNWRKLFSNGEKLSESSYLSPPTSFHKDEKLVTRCKKKKCKTRNAVDNVPEDKSEKDIGYYVAKLLLMSPESMENLNSISDDTITTISTDAQEEKEETVYSSDDSQTDVEEEKQLPDERDQSTDESESLDEEEFIRRMLEVKFPEKPVINTNVKVAESRTSTATKVLTPAKLETQVPLKDVSSSMSETDVAAKVPIVVHSSNGGDNSNGRSSRSGRSDDVFLKETPKTDLRLERLSNWIGTSIRRTLEAAAFNSTSSYDENDSYRQVNRLAQSLLERREYLLSSEMSSTSTRLSFSPIKVPDVRLSIPQISGTSL